MTRTQIQLPDELYQRAKAFAAERELPLAEITRRGLELFWNVFRRRLPRRVAEFATVNVKDFTGLGFSRVWNPLENK